MQGSLSFSQGMTSATCAISMPINVYNFIMLPETAQHDGTILHVLQAKNMHRRRTQIAEFMGPTWGPPGCCRLQMAPCLPNEPCYQGNYAITPHKILCKTALYLCCKLFILARMDAYVGFLRNENMMEAIVSLAGAWWCHQMETFPALLAICAGNSPVSGGFPAQMPVTWSFDICFDLRLNKRFGTQSCPLRRHCNGLRRQNYRSLGRLMVANCDITFYNRFIFITHCVLSVVFCLMLRL